MPPIPSRRRQTGLRTHQIRVLRALASAQGPLTRQKLSSKAGINVTVVNRALGYVDAEKRAQFEAHGKEGGFESLLTLGLVEMESLDIDGLEETVYRLTVLGHRAHDETKHEHIPPPRSSYG